MDLNDEKKLVERAKKDPEAFGELYEKNYSKIFSYILKRVADLDIAQDVCAETFLKVLKNIWKFRWRNIHFSAWLYRIANNEIANHYRKNKKKKVPLEKIPEPTSAIDLEEELMEAQDKLKNHEDFLKAQEKISKLPVKYQEVIILRFFEKKQIKEISEILGKKEGTVKSLLHRGIDQLRRGF